MRAISSNIDDRTLHELYLWPFAEGIRAGVGAVMTAYNEVNGSASSQNSMLINGILKVRNLTPIKTFTRGFTDLSIRRTNSVCLT
jgi:hypothetical protein